MPSFVLTHFFPSLMQFVCDGTVYLIATFFDVAKSVTAPMRSFHSFVPIFSCVCFLCILNHLLLALTALTGFARMYAVTCSAIALAAFAMTISLACDMTLKYTIATIVHFFPVAIQIFQRFCKWIVCVRADFVVTINSWKDRSINRPIIHVVTMRAVVAVAVVWNWWIAVCKIAVCRTDGNWNSFFWISFDTEVLQLECRIQYASAIPKAHELIVFCSR